MPSGGSRNGAGRPKNSGKFKGSTKPVRLPERIVNSIKELDRRETKEFVSCLEKLLIQLSHSKVQYQSALVREILPPSELPMQFPSTVAATFGISSISEQDNPGEPVDLHHLLVKNPTETFVMPVSGDSMNKAGIYDGDLLVIQKITDSLSQLRDGAIIVALINGNQTVKRYEMKKGKIFLVPESDNANHQCLELKQEDGFEVLGIVQYSIRQFSKSRFF
jgi:DNA polymerase V